MSTQTLATEARELLSQVTTGPDALESYINRSAELIGYGNTNRILLSKMDGAKNFATQAKFERDSEFKRVNWDQLHGVEVIVPSRGTKGGPVSFTMGKMYSAEEIGQRYPALAERAMQVAQRRNTFRNQERDDRLHQTTSTLKKFRVKQPKWIKDPVKRTEAHITQYLVFANSGLTDRPFKFSQAEREALGNMTTKEIGNLFSNATKTAKKLDYQVTQTFMQQVRNQNRQKGQQHGPKTQQLSFQPKKER